MSMNSSFNKDMNKVELHINYYQSRWLNFSKKYSEPYFKDSPVASGNRPDYSNNLIFQENQESRNYKSHDTIEYKDIIENRSNSSDSSRSNDNTNDDEDCILSRNY